MAELRERVLAGTPDDPWGWFDRAAVFALERVSAELDGGRRHDAAAALPRPPRCSATTR